MSPGQQQGCKTARSHSCQSDNGTCSATQVYSTGAGCKYNSTTVQQSLAMQHALGRSHPIRTPHTALCVLRGCSATSMHCCVPRVGAWEHIRTYIHTPSMWIQTSSQCAAFTNLRKARWAQERQQDRHCNTYAHRTAVEVAAPCNMKYKVAHTITPHHSSGASTGMQCMHAAAAEEEASPTHVKHKRIHLSTKWRIHQCTSTAGHPNHQMVPLDHQTVPPNSPSEQL